MQRKSHPREAWLSAARQRLGSARRRPDATRHRLGSARRRPGAARQRLGSARQWTVRLAAGLATRAAASVTHLRHMHRRPRHLAAPPTNRRIAAAFVVASLMIVGLVAGGVALASPQHRQRPAMASVDPHLRRQAAARASRSGRAAVAAAKPPSRAAAPAKPPSWVSPMPGVPLSSCFGPRWGTFHQGIDFAGKFGTTIRAVGAGTVFGAGWLYSGYGISVVINHGNGYFSHYAHMSTVLVGPGQRVRPGQPIGREGSTGDSTGPHLHFEIHHGLWHQINPAPWLRAHGVHSSC
jgi:murein DD-endopeptidase MepM/ murein hydrolase activator NlpD